MKDILTFWIGLVIGVFFTWFITYAYFTSNAIGIGVGHYNPTNGNFEYIVNTNK